jgi:hypothetical protein
LRFSPVRFPVSSPLDKKYLLLFQIVEEKAGPIPQKRHGPCFKECQMPTPRPAQRPAENETKPFYPAGGTL